jgi:glycosyltransferase involved in cell wall biosynthesis
VKILLINQYFYPDYSATSQIMTDLAEDFVKKGAEVSIIASRGHYLGQEVKLKRKEIYKGMKIYRVLCTNFGKRTLLGRFVDYFSFYLSSIFKSLLIKKHDFVITLSTPPLISQIGALLKFIKGSKFIYWVQDIYPDTAVRLKLLKNENLFTKILYLLSKFTLKKANRIVALGDYMKEIIVSKGIKKDKISVIHNWSDGSTIYPISKKENWFLDKFDLRDRFIILYSGNMGMGHCFSTILEGVRELKGFDDIVFLFIGDGIRKKEIEEFKKRNTLANIKFLPYQRREDLNFSLNSGDIHLISLENGLEGHIVPSKIYGIMAAGKPVIYIGPKNSEIADIIFESDCGFVIEEGDVNGFRNAIVNLYDDESLRKDMGLKAREYFEDYFDRKLSTEKFFNLLKS